jgi:hypothetical protein
LLVSEVVNDAYKYAYADAMANYVNENGNIGTYYQKSFVNQIDLYWKEKQKGGEEAVKCVKNFMKENLADNKSPLIDCITGVEGFFASDDKFVIKGVTVEYTDDNKYSTYIKVDIGIVPPSVNFGMEGGAVSLDSSPINVTDSIIYMNWQRY